MIDALAYLEIIEETDTRQKSKVRHKLSEIIGLTYFAMVANANDPEEIEIFGRSNEDFLREYFKFENGIPSHDTIERAIAMVAPEYLQRFRERFLEILNSNEGEKVRKILSIDGKSSEVTGATIKRQTILSAW